MEHRFQYDLALLATGSATVSVQQLVGSAYQNLPSNQTQSTSGTYTLAFEPTEESIRIVVASANGFALTNLTLDRDHVDTLVESYALHAGGYRYGFNGMEKDDEVKGAGNSYDFGARMYDSRLGRFLSLDPKASNLSWQSPYCFADNSPISQIDFNGEHGVPSVEIKGNQVVIGGKKWLEKSKYDFVIDKNAGGGQWLYNKAKREMGASAFGAALIVGFAIEEGGWGKGNNQAVTHNSFSLLQQTNNGQVGTEHGYPIIYRSYEESFNAFHDLLKEKYSSFLTLIKKDKITADDINKALRSGPFHKTGGYTNSDKGKAILGVMKYAITFTVDAINDEISNEKELLTKLENKLSNSSNYKGASGILKRIWDRAKVDYYRQSVQKKEDEVKKLNQAYENIEEKF